MLELRPWIFQGKYSMATERIMAEGTQGPEGSTAGGTQLSGEAGKEAISNASLSDKGRLQAARKSVGSELTPEQEKAILQAHQVGSGEGRAGIYTYNLGQLKEKARILKEAGFSGEQRRSLMEAGIVGRLPPTEFAGFDPKNYDSDPRLKRIAEQIDATGKAGNADEEFLYRTSARIESLVDEEKVDYAKAQELLNNLGMWRITAIEGPVSTDPLLSSRDIKRIEDEIKERGASPFNRARILYEYYNSINIASLPPDLQTELQNRRDASRAEIQAFVQQADQLNILDDVRKSALQFYKEVKATKRREKYGRGKQTVIDVGRNAYGEFFWGDSTELKQLEGRFKGVARYVWDGVVSEIDKEVNFEEAPALNPVAEDEFHRVKDQQRKDRLSEKKYTTHEYYGSRNWELTAESAEELVPAVLDWFRDQMAEISDTDLQSVHDQISKIRSVGVGLVETCRVRLETEERQKISETHPEFLRAKAVLEGGSDVLGYEKVIYKGGEDISAQYAERFASNYLGHHDAIYLNPKVAYALLKLRTHRRGTYWMGHDFSEEKVDEGSMRDYRQMIQEEIVEELSTHDIFISEDDFYKRSHIDNEVNPEGRDLRYSFNDNIEKLLLDPEDKQRQVIVASGDAEALRRHDIRVKVFRDIKARLDAKEGLGGLTAEQRQNAIRQRVIQKMHQKTGSGFLAVSTKEAMIKMETARQTGDVAAFDGAMWEWVKEYNNHRIKFQLKRWYPSGWDKVRMKIDRPERVIDRSLTDEQLEAMYEPIEGVSLEDYKKAYAIDTARFAFQLARSYAIFEMEDVILGGIRARVRDPKTGGPVDPDNKVVRIFDMVQQRLQKAIAEEAAELEKAKTTAQAEIARLKAAGKLKEAKEEQIKLDKEILSAQFLATHALKKLGFVDGSLPVWSQQLTDEAAINFFGEALAAYGVNVAYGEPISHNNKELLYEILERGRRALQSEYDWAAKEFMVGTYPVFPRDINGHPMPQFDANDNPIPAEAYMPNVRGGTATMSERKRIVNAGAVREHRSITDTRFETSTSGGVAVPELIPDIADMGFYPNLIKLGVGNIAGLHGYIKRQDELEAHEQKLFTSMDPVYSARERAAAYKAKKYLTGGTLDKGESTPGFLNEPFHGAFKSADWLHEQHEKAQSFGMENTSGYLSLMRQYRFLGKPYSEFVTSWSGEISFIQKGTLLKKKMKGADIERLRQLSYLDFDLLNKPMADQFYLTMYGVLDYFQNYLKATKPIVTSRGGRKFRSWEERNHKAWYAFRRLMREAIEVKKEKGFILRLGYAPEVASEIALRMMEIALSDADYLILRSYEVRRRVLDGVDILSKSLTEQEKQAGFVIPSEREWPKLRPEIKKALETIRRRGLLEFVKEEGYELVYNGGTREILGQKIPPLVQDEMIKQDPKKVKNTFS